MAIGAARRGLYGAIVVAAQYGGSGTCARVRRRCGVFL
jgi:hypothetical protein